eukprot:gene7661-11981_t
MKNQEEERKPVDQKDTEPLTEESSISTYQEKDFVVPKITEKDAAFMKSLLKQGTEWKEIASVRESENAPKIGKIHTSKKNFLRNMESVKQNRVSKYEILLPFNFEHVLCSSIPLSQQKRIDTSITNFQTLDISQDDKTHYITYIQTIKLPWPFSKRMIPCVSSIELDKENGKCLFISKPYEFEGIQDVEWGTNKSFHFESENGKNGKSKMYKMFEFKCIYIEKLKDKQTKYTQINLFSLGGWIKNDLFLRDVALNRGNLTLTGLLNNLKRLNSIKEIKELKTKKFYEEDGISQLLVNLQEKEHLINEEDISIRSLDQYSDNLGSVG